MVIEQDLLKEIFDDVLSESVEVRGLVDAFQKKLSVLAGDRVEMFAVAQFSDRELRGSARQICDPMNKRAMRLLEVDGWRVMLFGHLLDRKGTSV